ncbi:MAG TPA: CYTH domain-containing protein [Patescibacteria group bacterium]
MIEVEKKFKLNKKQLARIKKLAVFVSKRTFTDIYFDDKKFSLTSRDVWLRKRGKNFELKIPVVSSGAGKRVNIYREIIKEEKIIHALKLKKYSSNFILNLIKNGYRPFCKIETTRKKYAHKDFIIDIDEMDFGYSLCEIERMVKNRRAVAPAAKKIITLGKKLNLKIDWYLRGKVLEYLWRYDKKHYNKLRESRVIL